jgi:hypothetical protein
MEEERKTPLDGLAGNCLYTVVSLLFDGRGVFLPAAKWNVVRLRAKRARLLFPNQNDTDSDSDDA